MPALPPYRLQSLLEVRERRAEAAEQQLGTCMALLRKEQDKLRDMEQELVRMVQKREVRRREFLEKAMKGEVAALDAINNNKYLDRLKELEQAHKEAIVGQKAVVGQRQEDVEEARQALILANQELKALQKHRDKWAEALKKQRATKEEAQMDELAQTIYLRGEGGNHRGEK